MNTDALVIAFIILMLLIWALAHCYQAGYRQGVEDGWHRFEDQNRRHD
jgi:hypothetical protein